MRTKDFLSIRDLEPSEMRALLDLAIAIKKDPAPYAQALRGKTLAMIFEKPSLRTRVTFDVGIQQLGGFSIYLSPTEISLGKRESIEDIARNLDRMVQGLMIRTFAHDVVERMAKVVRIPVINGLTDLCHPCQALADLLTIEEIKGRLRGIKLAFLGDGNNVATSLAFASALSGIRFAIATPPGYELRPEAVAWAHTHATADAECLLTTDPNEAVRDADVVYTDVWASMGQETQAAERSRIFAPYQVNAALFGRAKKDAIFLHCLPAHRGEEVTADVIDTPRSLVFQQAENRLHTQKAVLLELMR